MKEIKKEQLNGYDPVSIIQLKGAPYQRLALDQNDVYQKVDCNQTANILSQESGYVSNINSLVSEVVDLLEPLTKDDGYDTLDGKIKHGEDLSFKEAFSLVAFVCSALNRPLQKALHGKIKNGASQETHLLQATALLSAISAKEAYRGLAPQEIAGFVAATIHLDTFVHVDHDTRYLLAIGGMGGDKGYKLGQTDTKFFSLSTLAAIALSTQVPVHKHHSYPNTSKVAGQSAIEAMGARSDFYTRQAMEKVARNTNLFMSSCHDTRTLHTLSHLLRGETINHVIGPLAFPIYGNTPTGAMIGVNEKIHPNTIVEAMRYLQHGGFQRYVNGVAFCGTDLKEVDKDQADLGLVDNDLFRNHVRIDELAPPPFCSLIGFLRNGQNMGTFVVTPEDFYEDYYLKGIKENMLSLFIPNTVEDILKANNEAISGFDEVKTKYLAMTVGLGLFLHTKLPLHDSLDLKERRVNRTYLRECTQQALRIFHTGKAQEKVQEYVTATKAFAAKR